MKNCLFALFAATLLWSCNADSDNKQNVFYYNESNGITSLDPAFSRDLEIMWATNQLFDGLVELDNDLKIVPCIASSWDVADSGKTYTFHLRPDVLFHPSAVFGADSTRAVVANDFVYSFSRIMDPEVASPGSWIFSLVDFENNNGFEASNDSTFIIHLKQAFQPFLGMLTMQYCNVVPHEAIDFYGPDFRSHPVGTGPFKMAFWYENIALVYHKHKTYFQKDELGNSLPYLDAIKIDFVKDMSVEFQGLLLGKYDFISGIHASFKDELLSPNGDLLEQYQDKLQFYKTPFIKTDYIGFYIDTASSYPTAQSKALRKAIEFAIDKNEMVKYLRNNTVVAADYGFVPPSLFPNPQTRLSNFDLEKSLEILKEAGFNEQNPVPEISIGTTSDYTDLIEYIQHSLKKIGVNAKVQVMQGSTLREESSKGQLPIFRKSWLADYPDPENFMSLFLTKNYCPIGPNYTHYTNSEFDGLYDQAITTDNDSLRFECYKSMNVLIAEDCPVIPIYYDQVSHFVSSKVLNWQINPVNMLDLKKVKKMN